MLWFTRRTHAALRLARVSAPGGFNGIGRDPVFSGKGMTLRFRTTADASVKGEESPPRNAVVTAQRADGATRVLRGRWRCGPVRQANVIFHAAGKRPRKMPIRVEEFPKAGEGVARALREPPLQSGTLRPPRP